MIRRPVAICIPARDEAERLPGLIHSLAAQRGLVSASPARVVVVANNCTDETVLVLQALQRDLQDRPLALEVLDVRLDEAEAHVGTARRLALDRGAAWLERDGAPEGVLLTTDADAIAPSDWVACNLAALDHAELVGGRLLIAADAEDDESLNPLHGRIERYWAGVRALEQLVDPPPYDPDPRHGDHTGASLALSVSLYRRIGGLPPLACGEDNALVTRVRIFGGRVRHCPAVTIAVSARRAGRVEGGMASEMGRRAAIVREGSAYEVPPIDEWLRLLERRAALRRGWTAYAAGASEERAFAALRLDADSLAAIAPATCPNDIAFVERAMLGDRRPAERLARVDLDTALAAIDAFLDGATWRRRVVA